MLLSNQALRWVWLRFPQHMYVHRKLPGPRKLDIVPLFCKQQLSVVDNENLFLFQRAGVVMTNRPMFPSPSNDKITMSLWQTMCSQIYQSVVRCGLVLSKASVRPYTVNGLEPSRAIVHFWPMLPTIDQLALGDPEKRTTSATTCAWALV